jgi:hypothetical protein
MTSFNSAKDSLLHGSDWPLCTVQCRPGCSTRPPALRAIHGFEYKDSHMTKSKLTTE